MTETWRKKQRRSGFWDVLQFHEATNSWITFAAVLNEERADTIISNAQQAQQVAALKTALEEAQKTFNLIRVLAEQHVELTTACSCSQWDIVGQWCKEELNRDALAAISGKETT